VKHLHFAYIFSWCLIKHKDNFTFIFFTNRNVKFSTSMSVEPHFNVCVNTLSGSSADGGTRISSGSAFPTWAEFQRQTYQCDGTSPNPSAAKVVSILQNVVTH
jgi:hypothetical protein